MDTQIGRTGLVRWQGRRIAPEQRARSRVARVVLTISLLSAVSLVAGFYSGLPIPIGLLQTIFALLVVGFAAYGAGAAFEVLTHRDERRVVRSHRR